MRTHHHILALMLSALLLLTPALSLAQETAVPEATQMETPAPEAAEPQETAEPIAETPLPEATQAPSAPELISQYTKLDLSPYKGKAIYLNFFTKWCPYCMRELPDIKKIYEDYDPDELQIVLVHVWDGEGAEESQQIKDEYDLHSMTFYEDEDRMLSYMVGLQGYPMSLFIDKDSSIYSAINYAVDYDALAEVLDGMGVAKKESAK